MTLTIALISLLAGAASWTLAEYCIHRWMGHDRRFRKNMFALEHTAHHSKGDYFAPAWKKGAAAVVVTAVLIGPAILLAGPMAGSLYVVGLVAMYLAYELLHRLEHVHQGIGAYGRWARSHHFYHHFHDPSMNHGVTSPVWDMVFGTYVKPDVIRVPEKLKMSWLCDPETGEVHPHLRSRYALRRSGTATDRRSSSAETSDRAADAAPPRRSPPVGA